MRRKAIVTGGMGFIGKHVVDQLLKENFEVLIIDNFETSEMTKEFSISTVPVAPGQPFSLGGGAAGLIKENLIAIKEDTLKRAMFGYPYVFHLAALPRVEPSIQDPMKYHIANVDVSLKVMKAAKDLGAERFVFSSSSSVYGDPNVTPTPEDADLNPMSPYALHKLISEQYLDLFHKLYNFNSVSLRYFNVYGSGQPTKGAYVPVMGIFFRQKKIGRPLIITGDGTQTRDFVNVIDVAKANVAAALADLPPGHHKFNIASGKNYSINEIAQEISPERTSGPPRFEPHTTLGDVTKAKDILKWEPTIDLMDWVKGNKPKK